MSYTRGQLEEIQAGVYVPEPVTITFDGTGNNGKVAAASALTTALTGTNNDLTFTAASNGIAGDDITIEYTKDRKPTGSALEVEVSGSAITVNLLTSLGVKATGTLTSTGVFSNTETVTIGDTTYTFVSALSAGPTVPYEVLIGASAAASLDNLKSAVNGTAGVGTTYSVGTEAHPDVTATTNADDSQVFEAIEVGTAGNAIATTSTAADNAFGATTLGSGEDVDQILTLASEVDAAIDAHTAAAALVTPANAGGNDGTGVVTTMAATNLTGGSDGTVDLFTIEADGLIAILGDCSTDLTGATATLEVGFTGNTAALIPQATATTLDQNERIDRTGVISTTTVPDVKPFMPVRAGDVVKLTVGTATITAGVVDWQLFYKSFDREKLEITNDAGDPIGVTEQYAPVYEDNTNGKAVVEHRYTPFRATADAQIKAGAGFIHAISVNPTTATPTAGLLTIYDSLTETGTILHSEWVFATSPGHTILLDMTFATGLYVGYDATLANVSVDGTYR